VVDGHPICDLCGRAVELSGPEQWRHGNGRRAPQLTNPELEELPVYREYRARLTAAGRLRSLGARDNPYLELALLLANAPADAQRLLDLEARRRELASLFSWAIPTEPALAILAKHAPLLECGAGMGYWAALLRARGVDALAYDLAPPGAVRNAWHRRGRQPWTEVQSASAASAARRHRERTLVLCWPPYDDDAASYGALRAYRGDALIHIGERDEGATGSVRFHRELKLNWTLDEELELPHWPRLRDRLMVYRRNAERQPLAERDRCFECRRFIATGSIGRCDTCFRLRPPALALRVGRHRVEYPQAVVDAMPPALRKAFAASPNRIRRG
jgi:hypothetical protein